MVDDMTDNGAAALASILHDIYGCRITCRGGRLADDRHPSHAEAYLDTARAILDALDSAGWRLTARDKTSPNERTIATLRAALEGAVAELEKPTELHDYRGGFHRSPDCPGCMMLARLRAALATAKEAGG
jgi:hypothetical protein